MLTTIEKRVIELIRSAKEVTVSINYGTPDELSVIVGGRAPHDIALAVQSLFINEHKTVTK